MSEITWTRGDQLTPEQRQEAKEKFAFFFDDCGKWQGMIEMNHFHFVITTRGHVDKRYNPWAYNKETDHA